MPSKRHESLMLEANLILTQNDLISSKENLNCVTVFDYTYLISLIKPAQTSLVDLHDFHQGLVVAQFRPFSNLTDLGHLQFDKSEHLLFTSSSDFGEFRIFQIINHPKDANQTLVNLMYVLNRGNSPSLLRRVVFSSDSRWLSVTTNHGTVHLFSLNSSKVKTNSNRSQNGHNQMSPRKISSGVDGNQSQAIESLQSIFTASSNSAFNCLKNPRIPSASHETIELSAKARLRPRLESFFTNSTNQLKSLTKSIYPERKISEGCVYHDYQEYRKIISNKLDNNEFSGLSIGSFFLDDLLKSQNPSILSNTHTLMIYVITLDLLVVEYKLTIRNEVNSEPCNFSRQDNFSIVLDEEPQRQWNLDVNLADRFIDNVMIRSTETTCSSENAMSSKSHSHFNEKKGKDFWLTEVELKTLENPVNLKPQFKFNSRDSQSETPSILIKDCVATIRSCSKTSNEYTAKRKTRFSNGNITTHQISPSLSSIPSERSKAIEIFDRRRKNDYAIQSSGDGSFKVESFSSGSSHILILNSNFTSNSISSLGDSFSSKSFDDSITRSIAEAMIDDQMPRRRKSSSSSSSIPPKCRTTQFQFPLTTPINYSNGNEGSSSDLSELQLSPDGSEHGECFFIDPEEFEELKIVD